MAKALSLIGISGSRVGQATVFTERNTSVGSDAKCGVVLHDRQILPRHAELRVSLERWFIAPLDPKAAVFVNGQAVSGQQRVNEGDLVTLGSATFKATLGELERSVGGREQDRSGPASEDFWRD
jgi:pSer/pThr/pTyr-binding forkhead associated (FHA) protein